MSDMHYYKLTETTKWEGCGFKVNNYIYYVSDRNTRLHGYQREEGGEFFPFKSNIFSTKGRTFKKQRVSQLPV